MLEQSYLYQSYRCFKELRKKTGQKLGGRRKLFELDSDDLTRGHAFLLKNI
jgi:hypothetical protein